MSEFTPGSNTLSVGMAETKSVLTFVITLAKAVDQSAADGKINLTDVANFIPVVMTIGPALAGLKEMQVELKAITPAEAADLKAWVITQVPNVVSDQHVDEFIQGAFAVVLDLWIVIRNFFLIAGAQVAADTTPSAEVLPTTNN